MKRISMDNLGELQKAVMETVWDLGEATARQVQARINKRKRLAYTSILTIMRRLEKAGWLTHRRDGQTYVYRPAFTRKQERTRTLKRIIDLVFQGDSRLLFEHLIEGEDLADEDLAALRTMIDKKRREKKNA